MKSLFNSADNQEIVHRINSLTPSSKAQWGKMNVAQMLKHAQVGLQGAFGDIKFKRGLIAILFGGMIKKTLTKPEPFKLNLPTDKAFIVVEQRNFEEEKEKLLALVNRFMKEGHSGMTKDPHPFFGKMTSEEWDKLQWKHLDHHLRQFAA